MREGSMTDKTKRVTREDVRLALIATGWYPDLDAEDFGPLVKAIFDALPADPPAWGTGLYDQGETETKRVTREDLAEAIGDQHWGWLAWTDADTNNPRALRAFRNVADAIFDALPADPPVSAGHNHAGDFCDPLTCPWRPASVDVDAARAALLEAVPSDWGRARVRAFEAAIRAEAGGLDVEAAREALLDALTSWFSLALRDQDFAGFSDWRALAVDAMEGHPNGAAKNGIRPAIDAFEAAIRAEAIGARLAKDAER